MNNYLFSRFLDTVGDGSGIKNSAVDHSGAAEEYKLVANEQEVLICHRILITVVGSALDKGGYVGAGALSKGIKLELRDTSGHSIIDFTDGITIKTLPSWGRYSFDVALHEAAGSGDDTFLVRWSFDKYGQPITLAGSKDLYLAMTINDDLSGLTEHYAVIDGHNTRESY